MGGQRDTQHDTVNQSGMLIGSHDPFPTSRFQAEVSFCPGEVTLNDRTQTQMKTPLAREEQRDQGLLATSTQVVIDDKTRVQDGMDEIQDWISEVAGIRSYDGDLKTEEGDCQFQQQNG